MMGHSHAVTGAAAWVAVSCTVPGALGLYPMPLNGVLLGAVVCAGAALLPDADHPHATIAQSIPVLGKAGANTVSGIAGGHRHGTHSLAAVPLMLGLAWLLQFAVVRPEWWFAPIWWGAFFAVAPLMAFSMKVLKAVGSWRSAWLVGVPVGAVVALCAPDYPGWVSWALVTGFVTHLLGGFLTIGGLPLLWPWNPKPPKALHHMPIVRLVWMRNGYFALPVLWKTGSVLEWVLVALVWVCLLWILAAQVLFELGALGAVMGFES